MRDMSFGQYYPTASPIHKLDARVKILLSVLYIVFIFFVPSYVGYFVTLLFITAVFIIGKIPMRAMLNFFSLSLWRRSMSFFIRKARYL